MVLERRGIAAAAVDAYALPLDAEPILEMARHARAAVLAVEDNYAGGLGSELAEASAALAAPITVESLGVRRIPKSGRTPADVLDYVGCRCRRSPRRRNGCRGAWAKGRSPADSLRRSSAARGVHSRDLGLSARESWIRINNITRRVVANAIPDLQRDFGESQ